MNANRLSYGPFSKKFERAFAAAHDVQYACFMNSGTDALRIALSAFKSRFHWKDGDEVLIPSVTFIATANVVVQNKLSPVFVDVDAKTYNIDPMKIKAKLSRKSRAIIPVHLMGLPCDMDPIGALGKKHDLRIIEDSCETMFGTYKGRKVGSLGDVGTFSTYVAHFLVTGVGGFTTTNDSDLAVDIRSFVNHGRDPSYLSIDDDRDLEADKFSEIIKKRFQFIRVGYSSRCTEMEAALGLAQLEEKDEIIKARRAIAERYIKGLTDLSDRLQLPLEPEGSRHMYMLFPLVVRGEDKRDFVYHLEKNNIETRDLMPLLSQPIYSGTVKNIEKEYPVAYWLNRSGLYIGCHQHLSVEEQDYVIAKIHEYFKKY